MARCTSAGSSKFNHRGFRSKLSPKDFLLGFASAFAYGEVSMKTSLRRIRTLVVVAFISYSALLYADHPAPSMEAGPALAELKAGNARFAAEATSRSKPTRARRAETAQSQHPFAVIVGCSDSRTPPEMIFDQNIGDLFVVRTAGEVVGDYELGSIEYAVEHLGARLIVVLGHARCGAVQAAVAGDNAPGHVGAIVRDIRPAVQSVRGQSGDLLLNAINSNTDRVAGEIRQKAQLGSLASDVRVVESYYDFDTGKVEWLGNTETRKN
jgi:carbonic anhydrase